VIPPDSKLDGSPAKMTDDEVSAFLGELDALYLGTEGEIDDAQRKVRKNLQFKMAAHRCALGVLRGGTATAAAEIKSAEEQIRFHAKRREVWQDTLDRNRVFTQLWAEQARAVMRGEEGE